MADAKKDKIVPLGDLIVGGEKSKECVDLILEARNDIETIAIMGNHEEWMLQTKNDCAKHSWILSMEGLKTIRS
ncbi:MAG: metallophosphoesterase [Spirochaetaceae bacterium]|nr:metallophosphoesterase [Spirochaetaceae bacterium]